MVNLGIKVPPDELIKAYQEHKPDAIGLSGLLVKSAQQMVITAGDLKDAWHPCAAAGGRRRAVGEVHQDENRAELRRADVLRQGRHDRAAADERDHGSGHARAVLSSHIFSRKPAEAPALVAEAP